MKKENGITLIALIISIIVLIILAGISINTLNTNGIFERAKEAKDKLRNAQEDEEIQISKYSNEINNYIGSGRTLNNISYLTTEQDTGLKWVDGKSIYQRCWNVDITMPGNASHYIYRVADLDIDCLIKSIAIFKGIDNSERFNSDGYGLCTYTKDNDGSYFEITQKWTSAANVEKCVGIIAQYTKNEN